MARKQGVKSLKFKYRKDPDWLPVCIDQEGDDLSDDEGQENYGSGDDSDDKDYVPDLLARGDGDSDSSDEENSDDEDSDSDDEDDHPDEMDEEEVAGVLQQPEPRGVNCRLESSETEAAAP